MSLPYQSWLIHDGLMLTGPVRPRTSAHHGAIRAAVRTRRLARLRAA